MDLDECFGDLGSFPAYAPVIARKVRCVLGRISVEIHSIRRRPLVLRGSNDELGQKLNRSLLSFGVPALLRRLLRGGAWRVNYCVTLKATRQQSPQADDQEYFPWPATFGNPTAPLLKIRTDVKVQDSPDNATGRKEFLSNLKLPD